MRTTVITTEILGGPIALSREAQPMPWPATGLRTMDSEQFSVNSEQWAADSEEPTENSEMLAEEVDQSLISNLQSLPTNLPSPNTITGTIILRYEQDEAALTGTWVNVNSTQASNGSYLRADALGETAVIRSIRRVRHRNDRLVPSYRPSCG